MGKANRLLGGEDYKLFSEGKGKTLSRQDAINAQCFVCNGGSREDCRGEKTCTLYYYSMYYHEK